MWCLLVVLIVIWCYYTIDINALIYGGLIGRMWKWDTLTSIGKALVRLNDSNYEGYEEAVNRMYNQYFYFIEHSNISILCFVLLFFFVCLLLLGVHFKSHTSTILYTSPWQLLMDKCAQMIWYHLLVIMKHVPV